MLNNVVENETFKLEGATDVTIALRIQGSNSSSYNRANEAKCAFISRTECLLSRL
jgi:hypothetical protein